MDAINLHTCTLNCFVQMNKLYTEHLLSKSKVSGHTNEEDSSLHYQERQSQHGIWQQCDSRMQFVRIEQQHELPTFQAKMST